MRSRRGSSRWREKGRPTLTTTSPERRDRAEQLARLASEPFDLAVVGGGITGAGIALDAATRGLRVALIERHDAAFGTSSRTTKLIHGGLRYLAQGQPGVTRDASIERRRLLQLAPHLVHGLPFVVPVTGLVDRFSMTAALTAYDLLASFKNVRNHHRLSKAELLRWFPVLRGAPYSGGLVYYDGQTDDVRLTVTVWLEALRHGAAAANHCAAIGLRGDGRVQGVECRDTLSGGTFTVAARRVVLACGVWVDEILNQRLPDHRPLVKPAKGVHLILPRAPFGDRAALLLRYPKDGRYLFVVPWKDRTLIGTTDTGYHGDLDDPPVTAGDVRYLLQAVQRCIPGARVSERDVIGVQAGLRPLVNASANSADALSREDKITVTPAGVLVIVGGKLTTYRHMAEKVVDRAAALLVQDGALKAVPPCRTTELPLGGFPAGALGELGRQELLRELRAQLPRDVSEHLLASYGAGAARIGQLAAAEPALAERLAADLPIIMAEARYAAEHELAATLGDILTRRLGLTLLDPRGAAARAPDVAATVAPALGWDAAACAREVAAYRAEAVQHTWG